MDHHVLHGRSPVKSAKQSYKGVKWKTLMSMNQKPGLSLQHRNKSKKPTITLEKKKKTTAIAIQTMAKAIRTKKALS